jgi:hypothetical protein
LEFPVGYLGGDPVAVFPEIVLDGGVLVEMPCVCDQADVEGGSGEAELASVERQGIFVRVAGAVVGLGCVADDA